MQTIPFLVETVESQPFSENTYIAHFPDREDCLIIDPGFEPAPILEYISQHQLTPAAILNTHGHSDHIAGNGAMKQAWPDCPLVIGKRDADKLTDPEKNLSAPFGFDLISPKADQTLDDGDDFAAAGFEFHVREIPGHSIGHIIFVWQAGQPNVVFGGDVLFAGSIGRTDFPDGSFEQLADGIRKKLYTLPEETLVLPGHGPPTTVGHERQTNPYVRME